MPETCKRCGADMTSDEAALNYKYVGRHVTDFLCPACLGHDLGATPETMRHMIDVFRSQGCRLFSPMPTDATGSQGTPGKPGKPGTP